MTAVSNQPALHETVLVVEDEADLQQLIAFHVRNAGFAVELARTGEAALARAKETHPLVVVLDLMLPDMLGTAVCGAIRHTPSLRDVGVLMVTARTSENDRIEGLEAGADDYLGKPFNVRELVLRVQSLAKRTRDVRAARSAPSGVTLTWRGIEVDLKRHRVTLDGVDHPLRPLELKLLVTFLSEPDRTLTRADLLKTVWGIDEETDTRTVDTHVRRLREGLGVYGAAIETVYRSGYRLRREKE
jgi:two-component system phosphate regulon response regulator PhoB